MVAVRKLGSAAFAVTATLGIAACGPGTPPADNPPQSEWVPFEGEQMVQSNGEITLRDSSGTTLIMGADDVRRGPAGIEIRVGGKILGAVVDGDDPARSGRRSILPLVTRNALDPAPTVTASSTVSARVTLGPNGEPMDSPPGDDRPPPPPSSTTSSSYGCWGVYKVDCRDGAFLGFCVGFQFCPP